MEHSQPLDLHCKPSDDGFGHFCSSAKLAQKERASVNRFGLFTALGLSRSLLDDGDSKQASLSFQNGQNVWAFAFLSQGSGLALPEPGIALF